MSDRKKMASLKDREEALRKTYEEGEYPSFEEICETQKVFAERFFGELDQLHPHAKEKITKEMMIAILDECSEILNWTNWKYWKTPAANLPDVHEIRYEIIDLLHFVLELALVWGLDAKSIKTIYMSKMEENIRRQKTGY
tara:strand:+ start:1509 stop:1928 length:420 start_codon:yes stop_codon:yes gene_type:complete